MGRRHCGARVAGFAAGMARAVLRNAGLAAGALWCALGVLPSFAETAAVPIYMEGGSLQATMLASRVAAGEMMAGQAHARGAVKLGPWHQATGPLDELHLMKAPPDPAAQQPKGQSDPRSANRPLWEPRPNWVDARPFGIPSPLAVMGRKITASEPVCLLVGVGGGDRLEILLDGQPVFEAETAIPYGRYGTSQHLDGTRVDQVAVGLSLSEGEHWLVLRVRQESAGPHEAYFSMSPDPVPFLWRQIEAGFSRQTHHLLEAVDSAWFSADGWFAQEDVRFERQLLTRLLETLGGHGSLVAQPLTRLEAEEVPASDGRWLDLCVTASELHAALGTLDTLRASVVSLGESYPDHYPGGPFVARLDDLKRRLLGQAADRLDPRDEATRLLAAELESSRREMLVSENPLLKGQRLVFLRRFTYDSQHFYDDYYQGVRKYGGSLASLSIDDGTVTDLLPKLTGGVFDRFDLSFDAKRVVFGYRRPRPEGFRIWEADLGGENLRQITFEPDDEPDRVARYTLHSASAVAENPILHGHWTDDMHPCYLPNGQILFASSRCERTAVCGGHKLPCTVLYRANRDGTGMERVSQGMLSEFTPSLLDDGRLLYTRWEYVYKGIAAIQPLWVMRPDGSASEEIYGDNIRDPGVFYQARQVPGRPNLIVANGCGHEPLSIGAIYLLDLHRDKRTGAVMRNLTPDTEVRNLRGLFQRRNGTWRADDLYGPFFCDPFPLSEHYFLVACNPHARYNHESAYGIYLLDTFGNVVPIYDDPRMSCFVPTLLAPRRKPPVLPESSGAAAVAKTLRESPSNQSAEGKATVLLQDVYRGLPGVARGSVKYLRVLRQIPRPWSVWPAAADDRFPGQMVAVSWHSHIWIAVLEGVVPVHDDGSAYFQVPADSNIYFQALDENFMEIQRMRTFVNFRPGEERSCIGCHEHRRQTPPRGSSGMPSALAFSPAWPGPQPDDIAPRPLHYETDIQPIFDKHCIHCHGDTKPEADLALTGTLTTHFNRSYEQIMSKQLIKAVIEWAPPPGRGSSWQWSMEHAPPIEPYTYGSHASRLIEVLRKPHYEVELAKPEFVKLVTWADTNGQYYGSYFGYRNARYREREDFRPHPTLKSAYGIRPNFDPAVPLDPVPAKLVAHWPFDEGQGETVDDHSGGGRNGQVVGARWTDGRLGHALQFSGNADFVRAGDFDDPFDTLSIALWVKTESHKNRWNPLLFCDTWSEHDLHLSVHSSGTVNVAIHHGSAGGYHRASEAPVGDGRWHHVALVCDQRFGGHLQFHVDGKPDQRHPLYRMELPVRLTGIRLGGYNVWEKNPGANFHGSLDDVRIYRGMLTAEQVAQLASPASAPLRNGFRPQEAAQAGGDK